MRPAAAAHLGQVRPGGRICDLCRRAVRRLLLDLLLVMGCVHEWHWTITLNADGTTTMTSPDGKRVFHSHSPPNVAA
jgi:hypothetical protein